LKEQTAFWAEIEAIPGKTTMQADFACFVARLLLLLGGK